MWGLGSGAWGIGHGGGSGEWGVGELAYLGIYVRGEEENGICEMGGVGGKWRVCMLAYVRGRGKRED